MILEPMVLNVPKPVVTVLVLVTHNLAYAHLDVKRDGSAQNALKV